MKTIRRLALMIDADNAQASLVPQILAEVSKHGNITIRRVYGDWTTPQLGSWKEATNTYALKPEQQFGYTTGKNSTDSALIIDAMDIIYSAGVDGICIVSSDSDYTRLASRIREKNLFVMGIGRKITPPAFVSACDIFVFTEDLQAENNETSAAAPDVITPTEAPKQKTPKVPVSTVKTATETKQKATPATSTKSTTEAKKKTTPPAKLKQLIQKAFEETAQDDGWAHLGALGASLSHLDPAFDARTYGHKQLSQLLENFPDFIEVKRKGKNGGEVYIRLKGSSKPVK